MDEILIYFHILPVCYNILLFYAWYTNCCSWLLGQASACSAGILHGHCFSFWLLHFGSSSWLTCLGRPPKMTQVHGLLIPWERPWGSSSFQTGTALLQPFRDWSRKWKVSFSFSPSIFCFLYLSFSINLWDKRKIHLKVQLLINGACDIQNTWQKPNKLLTSK